MYDKQLLIKLDTKTLSKLQKMSQESGLKLSSFARMVLLNFLKRQEMRRIEDEADIAILEGFEGTRGQDFDEVLNELNIE
ncbi:MAG: hypothetical protein Q8P68_06105 [Candidatus Peregrinibacteria bacterium]|nr:hypothetical protein [Candidatus Peregrinibacteria bacterium]MDZ4244769.1 hypothetical protein [Candidatus Gracilibacteria bacterium]